MGIMFGNKFPSKLPIPNYHNIDVHQNYVQVNLRLRYFPRKYFLIPKISVHCLSYMIANYDQKMFPQL